MLRRIRLLFTSADELETQILKQYLEKSLASIRQSLRKIYPQLQEAPEVLSSALMRERSQLLTKVLNLRMYMNEIMSIATNVRKNTEVVRAFQADKQASYLTAFEAKTLLYCSKMDMQIDALIKLVRSLESPDMEADSKNDTADTESTPKVLNSMLLELRDHFRNLLKLRHDSESWLKTKSKLKVPQAQSDKELKK